MHARPSCEVSDHKPVSDFFPGDFCVPVTRRCSWSLPGLTGEGGQDVLPGSAQCQLFFQLNFVFPWLLLDATRRAAPYGGGTKREDTRGKVSDSFTPGLGRYHP